MIELESANFDEVIHSPARPLVVLVALKKTGRSAGELEKEVEELRKIAKAWHKGGRPFQQPVWFAWIDGERDRKWLKQNYGCVGCTRTGRTLTNFPFTRQNQAHEDARCRVSGSSCKWQVVPQPPNMSDKVLCSRPTNTTTTRWKDPG